MWRAIDLVLRFAFCVIAPIMLAPMASVFPITGTLIGAGIATCVAMIGTDRWQAAVGNIPVLGRILGGMTRLGEFYAEHPPKPLIYYIFYPVLLPVILFRTIPRREFLLYRKVNSIALVVLVVIGAIDYFRHWQPELTFGQFLGGMIMAFIIQLFATFALVMPIVTTLLALRLRAKHKTLVALFVLAGLSAVGGVFAAKRMHTVPISTWMRIKERTAAGFAESRECMQAPAAVPRECMTKNRALLAIIEAIDKAHTSLQVHPLDHDGALAVARERLAEYYKSDEVNAFQLFAGQGVIMLFVEYGKHDRVWVARDAHHFFKPNELDKLPHDALVAMHLAK